ncbi:MAG: molybdopterin-dependent oxidoreductase [Acidimicrobiales bacterium]|nr:molybdopterin-dependent oxidoreductase [Acidimicrobiales bacterium]
MSRTSPAALATSVGRRYRSGLHETRTAAWLGVALGVAFGVCFLTGVWSHLAQDPPSWFTYPARPAGLYRVTQGVHVVTGTATIPLLLAKLWVVHPRLVEWPPARSVLHAVERAALLPLVGGALFLVVSGTANVARWYPWTFFFPRAHFWAAWITIGALVVHTGAKVGATRDVLRSPARTTSPGPATPGADDEVPMDAPVTTVGATPGDRRAFLVGVAAASGVLAVATAGGTVSPLDRFSVLAQRRPGVGPQGLPVNKTAVGARVVELARSPDYRLVIEGERAERCELTLADLRAQPQHEATLPIACVEGWSASARWRGVRVRDLVALAGVDASRAVTVESLQPSGLYRASELNPQQVADPDTLLALEIDGRVLHIDHGYPARLIGPNRPGVAQTKWVARLVVR